ncbi:type VI secretion system tip protein VgrG [Candidatus Methylospira mobilis]|uniref:Type VI secretion system tip protein VgrG n=1 Tax=Candidatus Methylospira mobilis TaxID=1808979 RepID=A0A5Q0BJ23_9GAMM|nr:type VI secretion system tip protein TssI/VgrG [Candidatus Methylospira mobilis]QFY42148.1 type VI secretion system tip protein VgrG [Candidatus Methylospira mobilis]
MNNIINQPHDNERRFLFSIPGSPATEFKVVSFEGEEEISTLYRFELLLASADCDIKAKSVVGKEAHFTLNDGFESGSSAIYRGLVEQFTLQHQVSGLTFYRAVLVPRLWKLESYRRSEVYLDKERHEIVRHVMNLAGLLSSEYEFRIKNSGEDIPVWDYICQYQESYLAFISRWCERLGIYWWFEEIDGREKAVFCNTHAGHKDKAISLRYQPAGELDANPVEIRRIQKLEQHYQILPRQVVVMDYFHKEGNGELQGTAEVDADGMGEIVLYGEHLRNNEEARLIASLRAEGIRCRSEQFQGHSNATGLRCGHFIEIDGHFRADFNRRLLVIRIKHQGSQAGLLLAGLDPQAIGARHAGPACNDFYLAEFTAIASDVQYRPEIRHPWPKIEGTLNAFIDGEGEGKYAELNEKGEYKIQVPFDITEKEASRGSTRVRMMTPFAGSDHGMHFPLHKRAEVLLSFVNGNPDQPVIMGAVPNPNNPSVVENNDQELSRIRTSSGNELVMGDMAGAEHMKLTSQGSWVRLGSSKSDLAVNGPEQSNSGRQGLALHSEGNSTFVTTGDSFNKTIGNALATTDGKKEERNYGEVYVLNDHGIKIENYPFNEAGFSSVLMNWGMSNVTNFGMSFVNNIGASNVTNVGPNFVMNIGPFNGLINLGCNYMLQAGPSLQHFTLKLINGQARINDIASRLDAAAVSIENITTGIKSTQVAVDKIGSAISATNSAVIDMNFSLHRTQQSVHRDEVLISSAVTSAKKVQSEITSSETTLREGLYMINSHLIVTP